MTTLGHDGVVLHSTDTIGTGQRTAGRTGSVSLDWWLTALAAWLFAGLSADGWAHAHDHVETFFSPWHAILYAAFLANAAFWAWRIVSAKRQGREWRAAIPRGYGLATVGVLLFGLSGLGDLAWHEILGIEVSVSAAFSPPHLGVMIGTGLIVSGPFIAAWTRSASPARWSEWLPVLLSLALTLSLITFVTQYSNPLVVTFASRRPLLQYHEALGAAGILLHAVVLMGGILTAVTRWTLPPGGLALVLTVNVAAMSIMRGRYFLIPAIVLAALGAEALLCRLRPSPSRRRQFHLFAFLVPVLYFFLYFAAVGIVQGITWPIPLWSGAALMAGVAAALLSYLILPGPFPRPSDSPLLDPGRGK